MNTSTTKNNGGTTRRTTKPTTRISTPNLDEENRRRMIAEAAYFTAEHRGFEPGREVDDWLQAERQINEQIGQRRSR